MYNLFISHIYIYNKKNRYISHKKKKWNTSFGTFSEVVLGVGEELQLGMAIQPSGQ